MKINKDKIPIENHYGPYKLSFKLCQKVYIGHTKWNVNITILFFINLKTFQNNENKGVKLNLLQSSKLNKCSCKNVYLKFYHHSRNIYVIVS